MQFISTGTTHKTATGTAVVAGGMPTAATRLRGMSRIDRNHRTPPFLGFVRHKGFQLGERPRMHAAAPFGFALDRCALPNVGQVFQHNRCARFDRCHDLLTEDMIGIPTKAGLFSAYPLQVPLGRLRALLLQRPLQVKQPPFDCFPCPFAQEMGSVGVISGLGTVTTTCSHQQPCWKIRSALSTG